VSHLFSIPEYANFYMNFMLEHSWVFESQDSQLDPTKRTLFYYSYSFCRQVRQADLDFILIVSAVSPGPYSADVGTKREAEIGWNSVTDDPGTCAASTVTPTAPATPQTTVTFVNAPITAARGLNATLQVRTSPNTSCSIAVDYKSGPSTRRVWAQRRPMVRAM
jgi:hypothetical protein